MKGTDHFKRTIYMYLEQRAEEDALFAKKYRNPAKNMDECVTHILNYVQKSGCNGFTDGEIFGQAIHYYEENEIEVGKPMDCQVVVNHVVKLTAEEKAEARQNAVRKYQEEELRKLQNRSKPRTAAPYQRHKLNGHTATALNISATAPRKGTSPVPTAVTSGTATADYATPLKAAPAPNAMPNSKCRTHADASTRKRRISA